MKTIMKSAIFDNKVVVINDPILQEKAVFKEKRIPLNENGIEGCITDISLNGVHLVSRDIRIANGNYAVQIEHDFSFIKLHFEMEGDNRYVPKNKKQRGIYIPNRHYNLFYLPQIKGELQYQTSRRKTLEITFTESYLKELFFPNFESTIPCLAKAIQLQKEFVMWENSKPISPKLHTIINDILHCQYTGKIKKAHLESKIVEILVHLFSIILNEETTEKTTEINDIDLQKIIVIEAILASQFKAKHSLKSLAATVGLNDFKVKKYFKLVYGTTVFSYLNQLKMDYAKQFLLENNCPISTVSEELGYKNPHHFTVAFKKKFGYLPSKLKGK
ncbi:helix-turn-helix domain-containing protein [Flavobacterium agrisoli]|uniref:Helix-turn-helix transcriptional regulator n=1 Tax=Flavobacterium agrisoli TaxID=2793066 RepID=A0A934UIV4_9FLAO|nr:AraC family transcriptional regulator [Flavobacterium agrisoli]MBK0369242.1 helix-turn-helix transcriptional regulator [Flavobacterium agrisoli]